jgi:hypothetical protein
MISTVLTVAVFKARALEVSCENVSDLDAIKTCFMVGKTSIYYETTIATNNDSVQGLRFYNNRKIQYLPVEVAKTFPNLLVYNAGGCSLKTLLKVNFEGLKKLKNLLLFSNQIEAIELEAFADLVDLEVLWLGK